MRKFLIVFGCLAALAIPPPAEAVPIIDFGTGAAGSGGSITLFSDGNLSGSNIPIGVVNITGAPQNNGVFAVQAQAANPVGVGALSFSTGGLAGVPNFITITGCIPYGSPTLVPCPATEPLLTGTISSFSLAFGNKGLSATGPDSKSATLLANLSLTGTPFAFFGFSLALSGLEVGVPGTADSTDFGNTAVPEPGSMLLLGTGLLGVASVVRRRLRK